MFSKDGLRVFGITAIAIVALGLWLEFGLDGKTVPSTPATPTAVVQQAAPVSAPSDFGIAKLCAIVVEFFVAVFILPAVIIGIIGSGIPGYQTVRSDRFSLGGSPIDRTYTYVPTGPIPGTSMIQNGGGILLLWVGLIAMYYVAAYGVYHGYPLNSVLTPVMKYAFSLL